MRTWACALLTVLPKYFYQLRKPLRLRDEYERVTSLINGVEAWDDDNMSEPIAMIVHTAYHLGEIRQALCVLKE